jgi:hypothetical protein
MTGGTSSEGESPVSLLDDVKPPAEFFTPFYQLDDTQVKSLPDFLTGFRIRIRISMDCNGRFLIPCML